MRSTLLCIIPIVWLHMSCSVGPSVPVTETDPEDTSTPISNLVTDALTQDGSFTRFVSLLESTGLGDVLRGAGPFTVFAPSDSALDRLAGLELETLSEEEQVEFLKYHIIVGELTGNATENTPWAATLGAERLHFAYENQKSVIDGLTQITRADTLADNGRYHRIDLPLLPDAILETLSIADVMSASPRFDDLEAALSQANLLSELHTDATTTFFAPSDPALRSATVDLETLEQTQLVEILKTHTIDGLLDSTALSELESMTSKSGRSIEVSSDADIILDQEVMIIWEDIMLSNGVIHIVDGVLSPVEDTQQ